MLKEAYEAGVREALRQHAATRTKHAEEPNYTGIGAGLGALGGGALSALRAKKHGLLLGELLLALGAGTGGGALAGALASRNRD